MTVPCRLKEEVALNIRFEDRSIGRGPYPIAVGGVPAQPVIGIGHGVGPYRGDLGKVRAARSLATLDLELGFVAAGIGPAQADQRRGEGARRRSQRLLRGKT